MDQGLTYDQQVAQYAQEHTIEEMEAQEVECYKVEDLLFLAHAKTARQKLDPRPHPRDAGQEL